MKDKSRLTVGLTMLIVGIMLMAIPMPSFGASEAEIDSVSGIPMSSTIYVGEYVFDFTKGEPRLDPALMANQPNAGEMGVYIVHMTGPIYQEWADRISGTSAEIITYVHNFAYQVRMTPEMASIVGKLPFVDWIGDYHPAYKISSAVTGNSISVSLYGDSIPQSSIDQVRSEINVIEESETGWGYVIRGETRSSYSIDAIAANAYVQQISPIYTKELNDEAGMQIVGGGLWVGDNDANHNTPYREYGNFGSKFNQVTGATGAGITIAVADTGLGNGNTGNAGHVDFENRVIGGYTYDGVDWADGHGHGTHCAGLAAANGYAGTGTTYAGFGPYYVGMGLGYDANLYGVKIFSDAGGFIGPTDDGDILVRSYSGGARISSNSWGAPTGGDYIDSDSNYDMRVRDASTAGGNQQISVFVAAGNSGSGTNTIGSPGNAKNVVTIGGVDNYMPDGRSYGNGDTNTANPDTMYASSSRGWTDDNRIKPDIVAPARNTLSTHSPSAGNNLFGYYSADNRYEWCTGTSQACPTAAGGGAAVNEWYIDTQGATPTPAMTKAILINTARDIGTADIPNQNEGWGRMDLTRISDNPDYFYFRDAPAELTTGAFHEYQVSYIDNTKPFKVTVVWTDRYAADGAAVALINDLRLQVFAPLGQEYRGNAFSGGYTPAGTNPIATFDTTGDGNDNRNNVECVYIPTTGLQTGLYTIRISGFNVPGDCDNDGANDQDYALVVYNAIDVTSQGTVDIQYDRYPREASVQVEVKDADLNTNTNVQTVTINLRSNAEPAGESMVLTETGGDTGIFRGTKTISATNSAGVLWVNAADVITATYNDANDGSGSPATVTDTAIVDGTAPASPTGLTVNWFGVSTQTLVNQDFSSTAFPPTGWAQSGPSNQWTRVTTANAGGTSPEARFGWVSNNNVWRLYVGPLDTSGMASLALQWRQMVDAYGVGITLKVQTSSDLSSWNDAGWSWVSTATNYAARLDSLTLTTADVGSSTFYLSWTAEGDAYQIDYWYIDNVLLTYTGGGLTDDNKLDWTLSSDDGGGSNDVDHYNIYRSSSSSGPWTTPYATVPAGTATYIDSGAGEFDGTNWWYVVRAVDDLGNTDTNTIAVPEIATSGATATATGPIGGPTNVAGITLTYTYTGTPTSVRLFRTTNGGSTWALVGTDNSVDGSYGTTLTIAGTYGWIAVAVGGSTSETDPVGGTAPEAESYIFDNVAPTISATTYADGATGVATAAGNYDATFSESMQAVGTFTTNLPGATGSWLNPTTYRIAYGALSYSTLYTVTYNTNYLDLAGNALGGDRVKEFTTGAAPAATATATGPTGGPTTVTGITITYTWTGTPTSVNLYYTTNGGTSWTLAGNDASVDGSYAWTCPGSGTYGWLASAVGGGSTEPSPPAGGTLPESSSYIVDVTPPAAPTGLTVEHYGPSGGAGGEAIQNGIFATNYDPWTLARPQTGGTSAWDGTQTATADGSGSVRSAATVTSTRNIVATEEGIWTQTFDATTSQVTVNGAYMAQFSQTGNQNFAPRATIQIQVYDTGDSAWHTVSTIGPLTANTAWTAFSPDATYTPIGQVNSARVRILAEVSTGGGGTAPSASAQGWADDISVYVADGSGGSPTDHNTLNWTASTSPDVAQYNIYRSDLEAGPYSLINTVPVGTHTYADLNMGLADAVLWWYIVRAEDALGNEELNNNAVQEPAMTDLPYHIDLTGRSAGDWVFVSFPIAISGNIETVLADPDGTNWDVAKWWDGSTQAWKSYRKGVSTNTFTTVNNQVGLWVHLTAVANNKLTTGVTGSYPSAAVEITLHAGWNMVGYPSATARAANVALSGTGATMVSVYQAASPYIQDYTNLASVTMSHGNAYWVLVPSATTWTLQP